MVEESVQEGTALETPSPLMDHVTLNWVELVEYEYDLEVA